MSNKQYISIGQCLYSWLILFQTLDESEASLPNLYTLFNVLISVTSTLSE